MFSRLVLLAAALPLLACSDDDPAASGPSTGRAPDPRLVPLTGATFSELGLVPFDVDRQDLAGPNSHDSNYGKTPEIVAAPGDGFIDVALRGTDETDGPNAVLVRLREGGGGFALEQAFGLPTLGHLLGFARAPDGTFFHATGNYDDELSVTYPAKGQHRPNVIHVYHSAADGVSLTDVDLDRARAKADPDSEPLVNPGVASSARLALAGAQVALVAGNNTAPDDNGTRHQKAVTTVLHAGTAEVRATSSIWVSHSFDQRYLTVGDDLFELHLGDAYPRAVVVTRLRDGAAGTPYELYWPKGDTGDNVTRTRLGDVVRVSGGSHDGAFVVAFSTERTAGTEERVSGARDLALVRLAPDFADHDPDTTPAVDASLGETWDVQSSGATTTNRAVFLTSFDAGGTSDHVERPKLLALPGGELLALYEHWTFDGTDQAFEGTYALRVDAEGTVLAGPTRLGDHHLPRGDDAFAYGGGAAWVTADEVTREITVHRVSAALDVSDVVVP